MASSRQIYLLGIGVWVALVGVRQATTQLRTERTLLRKAQVQLDGEKAEITKLQEQIKVSREQTDAARRELEEAKKIGSTGDATTARAIADWLTRVDRLKELVADRPNLTIPEMALLRDSSWFAAARDAKFDTEAQVRDALAELRSIAEDKLMTKLRSALARYVDAHDGKLPDDAHALAVFFDPPVSETMLDRYRMIAHGSISQQCGAVIEQDSPVDLERDRTYRLFAMGGGASSPALIARAKEATKAYAQAHGGIQPSEPEQLLPYLPQPVEPEKLRPYMDRASHK